MLAAAVALAGTAGARAAEQAVTPWASSGHAAARLLAAEPAPGDPEERAGLEIRLDPGFITYWRSPGEAGLPPSFDTSGSENVAGVEVDFPAPLRLDEGGSVAYGYTDGVVFPLRVTRADRTRPARLVVDLGYAVCEKLCLPATARLALPLPAGADPAVADRLRAARASVPRPAAAGAPGPLGIDSVAATAPGDIAVEARAAGDAVLFVEAPDGWYLQADRSMPAGPGRVSLHVAVLQRPEGAMLEGLALRLTLVDGAAAIDVPLRVDAPAPRL